MSTKNDFIFPRVVELENHHRIQFNFILRTSLIFLRGGDGYLILLQRMQSSYSKFETSFNLKKNDFRKMKIRNKSLFVFTQDIHHKRHPRQG